MLELEIDALMARVTLVANEPGCRLQTLLRATSCEKQTRRRYYATDWTAYDADGTCPL